jgi:hypothetical protein
MYRGKSTGAKTEEGRERCRFARWKHGFYAKAAIAERRRMQAVTAACVKRMKALRARPAA